MKWRALLCLLLAFLLTGHAHAAGRSVTVQVDGQPLSGDSFAENGVTYVHIVPLMQALGGGHTAWKAADRTAVSETDLVTLSVPIGSRQIQVNGCAYDINAPVLLRGGRTYVPVRAVAELLGAQVTFAGWDAPITVTTGQKAAYTDEDLYWLSRVISAESRGEPLLGQLAVGTVVMNRVASAQFPDKIRDVVFDNSGAVQFTPTANGTIYDEPAAASVLAARLVLNGARVVGGCLFFFAPALSQDTWIRENRTYYTTIGCHQFYL